MQIPISCLPDIRKPGEPVTCNAVACLKAVQSGRWAAQVLHVRNLYQEFGKSDAYKDAKSRLPAFIFAGVFGYVKNDDLQAASGLISIDLDDDTLHGKTLSDVHSRLRDDPYVMTSFLSPSGAGLKLLFRIPIVQDDAEFKCYFHAIKGYLRSTHEVDCDEACKDIRRGCYVSYDPDLYLNLDAQLFTEKYNPPKSYQPPRWPIPQFSGQADDRILRRAYRMLEHAPSHTKNETRIKAGRLVGGYIAGGQLPNHVADELKEVAASFSQNPKQARVDIEKGIAYGMAYPLTIEHTVRNRVDQRINMRRKRA